MLTTQCLRKRVRSFLAMLEEFGPKVELQAAVDLHGAKVSENIFGYCILHILPEKKNFDETGIKL